MKLGCLFGVHRSNDETSHDTRCNLCGTIYSSKDKADLGGIVCAKFGRLTVCDNCFEELEYAVISSMPQIIPWFIEMIKDREEKTSRLKKLIEEVKNALPK